MEQMRLPVTQWEMMVTRGVHGRNLRELRDYQRLDSRGCRVERMEQVVKLAAERLARRLLRQKMNILSVACHYGGQKSIFD